MCRFVCCSCLTERYQLPRISSFADLAAKLDAAGDFGSLRAAIAARLEEWEGEIKADWRAVLARVPKGRVVPRSYEEALEHVMRDDACNGRFHDLPAMPRRPLSHSAAPALRARSARRRARPPTTSRPRGASISRL